MSAETPEQQDEVILKAAIAILRNHGAMGAAEALADAMDTALGPPVIRKFTASGGAGIIHGAGQNKEEWTITKVMLYEGDTLLGTALLPVDSKAAHTLRPKGSVTIRFDAR